MRRDETGLGNAIRDLGMDRHCKGQAEMETADSLHSQTT